MPYPDNVSEIEVDSPLDRLCVDIEASRAWDKAAIDSPEEKLHDCEVTANPSGRGVEMHISLSYSVWWLDDSAAECEGQLVKALRAYLDRVARRIR